jgi:hydroxyacylglutathione hydrolase
MNELFPGVWQTQAEHPFPGLTTHAYLLTRAEGNVLLYGTGAMDELRPMRELGGVVRQYLSHRDEASPALLTIKQEFRSELCCQVLEADVVRAMCPVDITFEAREAFADGIEAIPTPGHTVGSASYVYRSPDGKTYLFTGDSIFPSGDSWGTLVLAGDGGSASDLKCSLLLLRALEPDVVISSGSVGRSPVQAVDARQWQEIIDNAVDLLP